MTSRQTAGSMRSGPPTMGEIPALQIQTSTPPHSATVPSATASLKSASRTSPLKTSDGPGQLGRDLLEIGFGASDEDDERAGVGERVRKELTEAATGAGDHDALGRCTSAPTGNSSGISICRSRPGDSSVSPGCRRIAPTVTHRLRRASHRADLVPTSTLHGSWTRTPVTDLLRSELHRRMLRIRGFEQRVAALYRDGEVPGFVHLSIGQEAAAVGACWPLRADDVITSTHRGHGHCLAKGLEPLGMFAELMARDAGTNRGRGGSMHIADPNLGIFGANGIVAAGLPIAVGAATAAQLRADDTVAVAFFGDGAAAQGAFHEALNLAAVWRRAGDLLLREQRLRRVLAGRDAARGDARTARARGTASTTWPSTATTSCSRRR